MKYMQRLSESAVRLQQESVNFNENNYIHNYAVGLEPSKRGVQ